jgi:hypothetical protein
LQLNDDQKYRATRVLKKRGWRCEQCGSYELSSDGIFMQTNPISIGAYCTNPGNVEHRKGLAITPSPQISDEDAREIGIPVPRRTPTPRRPPGSTAPMA